MKEFEQTNKNQGIKGMFDRWNQYTPPVRNYDVDSEPEEEKSILEQGLEIIKGKIERNRQALEGFLDPGNEYFETEEFMVEQLGRRFNSYSKFEPIRHRFVDQDGANLFQPYVYLSSWCSDLDGWTIESMKKNFGQEIAVEFHLEGLLLDEAIDATEEMEKAEMPPDCVGSTSYIITKEGALKKLISYDSTIDDPLNRLVVSKSDDLVTVESDFQVGEIEFVGSVLDSYYITLQRSKAIYLRQGGEIYE